MTGLTPPSHCGLLGTSVEGPGGRKPPRPNWQLLSSDVGVPLGPGSTLPFPPPTVRTTVPESLPPAVEQDSQVLNFADVFSRWETSSGAAHGPQTLRDVYAQPSYPLTPMVTKTLGIKDFAEKFRLRPYRKPLTMAYQKSETKDKYQGLPNLCTKTMRQEEPQPWELADHHAQGPNQAMIPSSKPPALPGRPSYLWEPSVFDHHQPYLTTTARDFRHYTRKELASCTQKCAMHPNFGEQPRLPVREPLQPLSRRVCLGQVRPAVRHHGALSLTRESYRSFQHPLHLAERFSPLEARWVGPQVQPISLLQTIPHVYQTENSRYGSLKHNFV